MPSLKALATRVLLVAVTSMGTITVANSQEFIDYTGDNDPRDVSMYVNSSNCHSFVAYIASNGRARYAKRQVSCSTFEGSWTIDTTINRLAHAVALDMSGTTPSMAIAIQHTFGDTERVVYATKTGSSWSYEVVLPVSIDGFTDIESISMAVGTGGPMIAYVAMFSSGSYQVRVATRIGANNWSTETIASSDSTGTAKFYFDVHLELDSGVPHVTYGTSYSGGSGLSLIYRKKDPSWISETIEAAGGESSALAVSGGVPQVAYFKNSEGMLYHAKRTGTDTWTKTALRPSGHGTNTIAMVIHGGYPFISYPARDADSLRLASQNASGWNFQRVAKTDRLDTRSGIGVGNYLTYKTVRFAYLAEPEGGDRVNYVDLIATTNGNSSARRDETQEGPSGGLSLTMDGLANGSLALSVTAPTADDYTLTLFDVTGRVVARHDLVRLARGTHHLTLDVGRLASGVYLARITGGSGIEARKRWAIVR